jgi:alkylhydroperoxidase/carboxymuconolactone decarboxylase family protein YurZ
MKNLPDSVPRLRRQYPKVWEAFSALGAACHEDGGPLDEKDRSLESWAWRLAAGTRARFIPQSGTRWRRA